MDDNTIRELAQDCREESTRYRRGRSGERGACFELFRRAIVERDQDAWDALYVQYRRLVGKWVGGPADRIDERVNRAFAKFWGAVDPDSFSNRFNTIGKVMSYLQLCARSVRIDGHRRNEKRRLLVRLEDARASTGDTTSRPALDNVVQQELFATIEQRLKDEQERLVIHLSFQVGLPPRHIAEECPDIFADAAEVRKVKERVVRRLSNDLALQDWWKRQTRLGKRE